MKGRYSIQHLQIKDLATFEIAKGNHYLVFWSEECPVGHLWVDGNKTAVNLKIFTDRIALALYPAFGFYVGQTEDSSKVLADLLQCENYAGLHDYFAAAINSWQNRSMRPLAEKPKLSVVVCTRNRPDDLECCLRSLINCSGHGFEIIVVDNCSDDDRTKAVAEKFPRVKYVFEPRKGLDIARNRGLREASGDIIAYTDDDVEVPVSWITTLEHCFADPVTMAVTGIVIPYELEHPAQILFEREYGFNKGYVVRSFDQVYFREMLPYGVPAWDVGAGANMAFRKQAFLLAGIFDERLDVGASGCSGDSEMWYRIMAEGWSCIYNPALYVFHHHRKSLPALRKQLFGYMRGHVSALLVQYENYGHEGNLLRVEKSLPSYYYRQIRYYLPRLRIRKLWNIYTEIKGCISGKKFYKEHQHLRRQDITCIDENEFSFPEKRNPLISVIIPCYNYGRFLSQAIDSCLNQTYQNIEIIVVDDGSDDNTAQVVASYGNRVKYVCVHRVGPSVARNIGVEHSKGQFLVFLDADDYLYVNAIELNLYYMEHHKDAAFVSGGHYKVSHRDSSIEIIGEDEGDGEGYLSLLQGNYVGLPAVVMYRRELFPFYHFSTRFPLCEDYEINLRIARDHPVYRHRQKVAAYRIHDSGLSRNKTKMLSEVLRVLAEEKKILKNDMEREAVAQGLANWENYYHNF